MKTCCSRLRDSAAALRALRGTGERRVLLTVWLLAPWLRLVMRLPLLWVSKLVIRPVSRHREPSTIPPARIAEIVALAQRSGHPIVRLGCLTRGMSLLWLLRRRGLDVELAFGIGGPADDHQGHCWLLKDGEPYLEPQDSAGRFIEVFRLPSRLPHDRGALVV